MDTLFFLASKLVWGLIGPGSWPVIGLGLVCLGLLLRWRRLAGWAATLTFAFVMAAAILPLGDYAMRPLEMRYPIPPEPERIDGILVLGGAEEGVWTVQGQQTRFNEGAERFTEALRLAKRHPEAKLVFSGGSAALGNTEARAEPQETSTAMVFFLEHGIPRAQIHMETASRNTAENASLSLGLVQPQPGETWLLVTSAFHMERSVRTFRAAGWPELLPWPVDFRVRQPGAGIGFNLPYNLRQLDIALKEYVGLVAYGLTGR